MKKILKLIIWIVIILVVIYLGLNIALGVFGKKLIISQLEKNLKRKTTLAGLNFSFPLSLNLSGLDIEDLIKVDYVSLRPSILGFLSGRVILNDLRLLRPQVIIEKSRDGQLSIPFLSSVSSGKQKAQESKPAKLPPILLAGFRVGDGRITFIDRGLTPKGYYVILNNINIDISKVSFPPQSLYTKFDIAANLADISSVTKGLLSASGWIDFGPKDMEGKIELKDVDALFLAPYYQRIISTAKLTAAKINFKADLKAKDNDLLAKCHLEFSDIVYAKPAQEETESRLAFPNLLSTTLDLFSNAQGKVILDFAINTRLDNPRINFASLKGTIAQAAAQNIAAQPPEKVIEKVKGTVEQIKEFGKQMKEIFKNKE